MSIKSIIKRSVVAVSTVAVMGALVSTPIAGAVGGAPVYKFAPTEYLKNELKVVMDLSETLGDTPQDRQKLQKAYDDLMGKISTNPDKYFRNDVSLSPIWGTVPSASGGTGIYKDLKTVDNDSVTGFITSSETPPIASRHAVGGDYTNYKQDRAARTVFNRPIKLGEVKEPSGKPLAIQSQKIVYVAYAIVSDIVNNNGLTDRAKDIIRSYGYTGDFEEGTIKDLYGLSSISQLPDGSDVNQVIPMNLKQWDEAVSSAPKNLRVEANDMYGNMQRIINLDTSIRNGNVISGFSGAVSSVSQALYTPTDYVVSTVGNTVMTGLSASSYFNESENKEEAWENALEMAKSWVSSTTELAYNPARKVRWNESAKDRDDRNMKQIEKTNKDAESLLLALWRAAQNVPDDAVKNSDIKVRLAQTPSEVNDVATEFNPSTTMMMIEPKITPNFGIENIAPDDMAKKNDVSYTPVTVSPGKTTKSTVNKKPNDAPTYTVNTDKLPQGWKVTVDPKTGEATITAPKNAKPGDKMNVPIIATYKDGSKDYPTIPVTVGKLDKDVYQPAYDSMSVLPGGKATKPQKVKNLPAGTTFTAGTKPAGWNVSVDKNTGAVTVTAPANAKPGSSVKVQVVAIYPDDGSRDIVDVPVTVLTPNKDTYQPSYDNTTVKPGKSADIPQKVTGLPQNTKFAPGDTSKLPQGWKATVDPSTGKVTVTLPENAKTGDTVNVPVNVTYPDGTSEAVNVPVTVGQLDKDAYEPAYDGTTVKPGKSADIPQKVTGLPQNTKFAPGDTSKLPQGWKATVDPSTGKVTVTLPENAKTGTKVEVPIVVTYPDGSKDNTTAKVTVGKLNKDAYQPKYDPASGKPGSTVTVPQKVTDLPENTKFTPGDTSKLPQGWKADVDPKTGKVTVTVPDGATLGDTVDVPVVVTYPDGSKDTVTVKVTVNKLDRDAYQPKYDPVTVAPGEKVTVPQKVTDLPENTKFTPGDTSKLPQGWKVDVDPKTGKVTVTAPKDAKNGDTANVPVVVTYPDTSTETVTVPVTVNGAETPGDTKTMADTISVSYPDTTIAPSGQKDVVLTGDIVPQGTVFELPASFDVPAGWSIVTDPATGVIHVTAPGDARLGNAVTVPVTVTYPDKSTTTVYATVTVQATNDGDTAVTTDADKHDPVYSQVTLAPGETGTSRHGDTTIPAGTKYAVDTQNPGFPAGYTATVDQDGVVTVTTPASAAPGSTVTIPVTVTYPDSSVDTVSVPVVVSNPVPSSTRSTEPTMSQRDTVSTPRHDTSTRSSEPSSSVAESSRVSQAPKPQRHNVSGDTATPAQQIVVSAGGAGPKVNTGGHTSSILARIMAIFS